MCLCVMFMVFSSNSKMVAARPGEGMDSSRNLAKQSAQPGEVYTTKKGWRKRDEGKDRKQNLKNGQRRETGSEMAPLEPGSLHQ